MNSESWPVLPHGELEPRGSHLLYVWGALAGSMPLKRVMAVAKKAGGGLVVHNGVCLDEANMAKLEAFGEPEDLIVPNGFHRMDAKRFKDRYPRLRVICPSGSRAKVEEVVKVDATIEEFGSDDRVRFEYVDGTRNAEGVMTVRGDDGASLVFNDALFNMPHQPGFGGFVARYVTGSSGGPKVSRLASMMLLKDKPAFKAQLERLAATPDLRRVLVAHHEVIDDDPARALRDVAATL